MDRTAGPIQVPSAHVQGTALTAINVIRFLCINSLFPSSVLYRCAAYGGLGLVIKLQPNVKLLNKIQRGREHPGIMVHTESSHENAEAKICKGEASPNLRTWLQTSLLPVASWIGYTYLSSQCWHQCPTMCKYIHFSKVSSAFVTVLIVVWTWQELVQILPNFWLALY